MQKPTPNSTSQFLAKRLAETGGVGGTLWKQIRNSVSRYMPISANSGQIDDHIQEYFCKAIARDSFSHRLNEGLAITDSQIVTFVIRSAFTDIRGWGKDPVTRVLYGARTERERDKAKAKKSDPITVCATSTSESRLVFSAEEDTKKSWIDVVDTESSMTPQAVEDQIQFNQIWTRVEKMLARKRGKHSSHFIDVARKRYVEGMTINELALSEQELNPIITVGLVADVRNALQNSKWLIS
jgi:hypothetical protein